jgi:chromosome segregation ATPase
MPVDRKMIVSIEEHDRLKSDLAICQEKLASERTHARDAEAALASEMVSHGTTRQELADQIRLSQGLERTANGFQQELARITAELGNKAARVGELTADLNTAHAVNDRLEAEAKELRPKAVEAGTLWTENITLRNDLADAKERVEALLRAAKSDARNLAVAEQERDEARTSYHEMYDARAKVAAQLSDLRRDTRDYDALRRTIRVVYAVVKVAIEDLTAVDGEIDANPDAAVPALHDALALLDATGAFAHRSDR